VSRFANIKQKAVGFFKQQASESSIIKLCYSKYTLLNSRERKLVLFLLSVVLIATIISAVMPIFNAVADANKKYILLQKQADILAKSKEALGRIDARGAVIVDKSNLKKFVQRTLTKSRLRPEKVRTYGDKLRIVWDKEVNTRSLFMFLDRVWNLGIMIEEVSIKKNSAKVILYAQ
jgi:hypothetical protein